MVTPVNRLINIEPQPTGPAGGGNVSQLIDAWETKHGFGDFAQALRDICPIDSSGGSVSTYPNDAIDGFRTFYNNGRGITDAFVKAIDDFLANPGVSEIPGIEEMILSKFPEFKKAMMLVVAQYYFEKGKAERGDKELAVKYMTVARRYLEESLKIKATGDEGRIKGMGVGDDYIEYEVGGQKKIWKFDFVFGAKGKADGFWDVYADKMLDYSKDLISRAKTSKVTDVPPTILVKRRFAIQKLREVYALTSNPEKYLEHVVEEEVAIANTLLFQEGKGLVPQIHAGGTQFSIKAEDNLNNYYIPKAAGDISNLNLFTYKEKPVDESIEAVRELYEAAQIDLATLIRLNPGAVVKKGRIDLKQYSLSEFKAVADFVEIMADVKKNPRDRMDANNDGILRLDWQKCYEKGLRVAQELQVPVEKYLVQAHGSELDLWRISNETGPFVGLKSELEKQFIAAGVPEASIPWDQLFKNPKIIDGDLFFLDTMTEADIRGIIKKLGITDKTKETELINRLVEAFKAERPNPVLGRVVCKALFDIGAAVKAKKSDVPLLWEKVAEIIGLNNKVVEFYNILQPNSYPEGKKGAQEYYYLDDYISYLYLDKLPYLRDPEGAEGVAPLKFSSKAGDARVAIESKIKELKSAKSSNDPVLIAKIIQELEKEIKILNGENASLRAAKQNIEMVNPDLMGWLIKEYPYIKTITRNELSSILGNDTSKWPDIFIDKDATVLVFKANVTTESIIGELNLNDQQAKDLKKLVKEAHIFYQLTYLRELREGAKKALEDAKLKKSQLQTIIDSKMPEEVIKVQEAALKKSIKALEDANEILEELGLDQVKIPDGLIE
ncbi:hypothetical protein ACFL5G_01265 [Candidatus Margulisiibacteriota bacterium]